jgi:hypothetical protein
MKYYILLSFFPIYYSLIKYKAYFKNLKFHKNHSLELTNNNFKGGYDSRENITDGLLPKIYENFEKMYLLKKLENNNINIHTKLSLISYYEILNKYPVSYIANLYAGGLLNDWDFI